MVMAKARTLLFEQWWREHVIVDPGAETPHRELFRHYRRAGHFTGMGEQAFTARLNEMSIGQRKVKGIRYRLGVRLRAGEADDASAPSATPPPPKVDHARDDRPARPPARAEAVRVVPYNPGESEGATMLMLDITAPEDEASGRVAGELFAERLRQRAPEGEGFGHAHDDRYAGDLALAASAYAFAAGQPEDYRDFLVMNGKPTRTANFGWHVLEIVRRLWPWDAAWWKPRTPREDLVRAGALVIAAIERLDRAEARGQLSAEERRQATGV